MTHLHQNLSGAAHTVMSLESSISSLQPIMNTHLASNEQNFHALEQLLLKLVTLLQQLHQHTLSTPPGITTALPQSIPKELTDCLYRLESSVDNLNQNPVTNFSWSTATTVHLHSD